MSFSERGTDTLHVTLSVADNYNISGYKLVWGSSIENVSYTTESSHTFELSNLTPGANYTFQGYTFNGDVDSQASDEEQTGTSKLRVEAVVAQSLIMKYRKRTYNFCTITSLY